MDEAQRKLHEIAVKLLIPPQGYPRAHEAMDPRYAYVGPILEGELAPVHEIAVCKKIYDWLEKVGPTAEEFDEDLVKAMLRILKVHDLENALRWVGGAFVTWQNGPWASLFRRAAMDCGLWPQAKVPPEPPRES